MDSLTLKEKIGQLVQLDGRFFGAEEVPTGPCAELGIEPWVAENAGSVLNVLGAEKVYDVQKRHLEHSRIRLLFMADIVYGYITSYPISLALACSWDMELVEECGKHTAYEASADEMCIRDSPIRGYLHSGGDKQNLEHPAPAVLWQNAQSDFLGQQPVSYTHLDVYKRQIRDKMRSK